MLALMSVSSAGITGPSRGNISPLHRQGGGKKRTESRRNSGLRSMGIPTGCSWPPFSQLMTQHLKFSNGPQSMNRYMSLYK